jgi:dTDP-L-rhamnose 4-epimerase
MMSHSRSRLGSVKALVTGGAGMIGSHLVDALLAEGRDVRILDNLDQGSHRGAPTWIPSEAEFIRGDVRDADCVARCLRGVDDVFHLAAAVGGVTAEISTFFDVNATGTARIFETLEREGIEIRKLVAASSQAIYGEGLYQCDVHGVVQPVLRSLARLSVGEWEPTCPECDHSLIPLLTDETARWNGATAYAVSKIAEERTAIGLGQRLGIPAVALRYAVVYGPRQSIFNPYTGILSIFSTLMLNGRQPRAFEDGDETRDFVFVEDVVEATMRVMKAEEADGVAINVGRGEPVTIKTVIELLAAAYGLEPDYVVSGEFRLGDVRHLALDARRIRALGWAPRTDLGDGLRALADWILGLGPLEDVFSETLANLRRQGIVHQSSRR